MKSTTMALWILCGMITLVAGCGGDYYRVNDPSGDRQYYTTDIDKTKTGAINFKDEKSVSPKLAASAFKIGQTYSRLGDYHKARLMFDRVLDQYSEGAEAHLARKALNVMPPQN